MFWRNLKHPFPGFFYPEYKENRFLQKHQELGTWSHNLGDTNLVDSAGSVQEPVAHLCEHSSVASGSILN